jgi:hypothetical protein
VPFAVVPIRYRRATASTHRGSSSRRPTRIWRPSLAKHDDGSLFDLKRDKADDIAVAIDNSVSEHKAKAIANGISAWFKTKQKPAG